MPLKVYIYTYEQEGFSVPSKSRKFETYEMTALHSVMVRKPKTGYDSTCFSGLTDKMQYLRGNSVNIPLCEKTRM